MQASFQILRLLGQGGFGKVYQATRLDTLGVVAKDVALKIRLQRNHSEDREMAARFRDEARMLELLRGVPGIPSVFEIFRAVSGQGEEIGWVISMQYVEGEDLSRMLKRGALPPYVALHILRKVADSLHRAYNIKAPFEEGEPHRSIELAHRDVKPGNIRITQDGDVKLMDFGVARADFAAREADTTLGGGALVGSPGYIAPEAILFALDARSVPENLRNHHRMEALGDIYALGCVFFETLMGESFHQYPKDTGLGDLVRFFQKNSDVVEKYQDFKTRQMNRLYEHLRGVQKVRTSTCQEIVGLCDKMLSWDPIQRLAHDKIRDAARELEGFFRPMFTVWAANPGSVRPEVEKRDDPLMGQYLYYSASQIPGEACVAEPTWVGDEVLDLDPGPSDILFTNETPLLKPNREQRTSDFLHMLEDEESDYTRFEPAPVPKQLKNPTPSPEESKTSQGIVIPWKVVWVMVGILVGSNLILAGLLIWALVF